jgi:hypothetical protein
MKHDDFQKAPKLFCESVQLAFTPEYFVMAINSGEQSAIYSFTPEHMKRLSQYLTHEIQAFEKAHGGIEARWDPSIMSPLQKKNPPSEKS